jgi:hypothetical protein
MIYDVGFTVANKGEANPDPTIGDKFNECLVSMFRGQLAEDLSNNEQLERELQ